MKSFPSVKTPSTSNNSNLIFFARFLDMAPILAPCSSGDGGSARPRAKRGTRDEIFCSSQARGSAAGGPPPASRGRQTFLARRLLDSHHAPRRQGRNQPDRARRTD